MNPQDVVSRALELLLAQDMAAFAGLWAHDGVLEFPFAAPGYPTRVDGRAAIVEYMRGYPDILHVDQIPHLVMHQSVDPDVVIVEFEATGTGLPEQPAAGWPRFAEAGCCSSRGLNSQCEVPSALCGRVSLST